MLNSSRPVARYVRFLCPPVVAVLLLFAPGTDMTAQQMGPKTQTAAPSAAQTPAPDYPVTISVADVAARAAEVANLLQSITQKLATSRDVETIRQSLPGVSRQIQQSLKQSEEILRGEPALPVLQAQQLQWRQMQTQITGWLAVLTKQSNVLQEELDRLIGMQKTWEATLTALQASKAPGPILQQVMQTIAAIKAAQGPLQNQLTAILDLQSSMAAELARCGTIMARIAQVQQESMSGILVQDSLPIVSAEFWAGALTGLRARVRGSVAAYLTEINRYFRDTSEGIPLHGGIFALLLLLFFASRHHARKLAAAGEKFSGAIRFFDHPIGAALTIMLLIMTSPYWPVPVVLRRTFQVLAFAPMILLILPVVSKRIFLGLYPLWLLLFVDAVREVFSGEPLIGQIVLMIESLGGMAAIIWFLHRIRHERGTSAEPSHARLLETGIALMLLIVTSGFVAAAAGYMRFARITTPGIIAGGALALTLYAALRVCMGVADIAFHVWPFRAVRLIQHNRDLLERRLYLLLVWLSVFGWTVRYLSYIGLLQPAQSFLNTLIHARYERGDFSISVGGVVEFFLTVWAAYMISTLLRVVLREDVFPRTRIAPGKSYAMSSLLHYFILALGFTAAIAALGVNLTKLTVLTGAFGVGIGFGLQSVVNNFVSGLILLFERPVQVGDTVEVGELLGRVRRIGIRASTVHTRQGADIIIPNSQLISEKVTNWTLSDMLRRIDLPVGVSYSAVPKEVIRVLEKVAINHPQVLADPPPQALFIDYGDSSINFELRSWTDSFDDWPRVRSELATAVFDAVRAAGMSFPFPQREVRLLRDSEGATARVSESPGGKG